MADHIERKDIDEALDRADELIATGDKAGAIAAVEAVAEDGRRFAGADPVLAELFGNVYELVDDYASAQRWYSIGLRGLEKLKLQNSEFYLQMLTNRYRVRRDAGLPLDVIDNETDELRKLSGR